MVNYGLKMVKKWSTKTKGGKSNHKLLIAFHDSCVVKLFDYAYSKLSSVSRGNSNQGSGAGNQEREVKS